MIEHNKTSVGKREMPDGKCRSGTTNGKTEMKTSRKLSAGSPPPDVQNYEQQLKMKLIDFTPRNRAKETSEGVQEFIKQVSDIIEKKNPFKEAQICPWPKPNSRSPKKNTNAPVIDSVQFNGVSKRPQGKEEDLESEPNCEIISDEINKKLMRRLKYRGKLNSLPVLKKEQIPRVKTNRPKSSTKKQGDKKQEKDTSVQSLRVEAKPIKFVAVRKESEDLTIPKRRPRTQETVAAAPVQNQIRRGRPSEIPLRKNRTDLTRKPKPLTVLMDKPSKEVGKTSTGLQSKSTVKDNGCPELQTTINADLSSEKISTIDDETEPKGPPLREKTSDNIKPTNISRTSSKELLEENSLTRKKSNTLDLETSSFTVLRNKSTVLNRLESHHRRNIQAKDKTATGKSSTQMALTPKSSFSTLKGKSSKKNLVNRLSGKGNKPGLKMKIRKSRKEVKVEPRIPRKRSKSNSESPRVNCDGIRGTRKVGSWGSGSRKIENRSIESIKTHKARKDNSPPPRVGSARRRSTSRRIATPIDKEEVETALAKEVEAVVLGSKSESQKLERPKSVRNSLLSQILSQQNTVVNDSAEKKIERALGLDSVTKVPMTPPPSLDDPNEFDFRLMEQDAEEDHWSSKTVIFEDKFHSGNYQWRAVKPEMHSKIIAKRTGTGPKDKTSLVVKGASLNVAKDEPPEGQDSPIVKKRLNIDLRAHGASSKLVDNGECESAVSVSNEEDSKEDLTAVKTSSSDMENGERKSQQTPNGYSGLFSIQINEPGPLSLVLQKSCSSLRRKSPLKFGGSMKGGKKKVTSDAGDRPSSLTNVVFSSDVSVNKNKLDSKVRSGLTKSFKWDEKTDIFEDLAALKLKRRNSEPNSFRGYVWKCADSTAPRDNKASVSSMTSSMRHLNTDEIDDFIFWEAVPQNMTSCWEMSLYHFKRPWSVLSCSVFKENRESSTPGLILENLRNGGTLNSRRFAVNHNERAVCRKENPFDVEPSIAQKNIDIRNWLAALNFPTLPSTSNDAFSEGSFSTPTGIDSQNLNKSQASPKRRKVVPNLKFSDEASKKKSEEKYRKSTKWCDEEGLTDLIRRKSGGFVTSEQFHNSEQSTAHRPNVTVNFCVYSKSNEESILLETSDRASVCEPRKYKSVEITSQPELSISATIISSGAVVGDQLVEKTKTKEKPSQETPAGSSMNNSANNGADSSMDIINIPKWEMAFIRHDINIWKYLFFFTVFVITIHYCYINSYMCRN